jgi:hypothetical protein
LTHRRFYTIHFYTHTLLHAKAFTHKSFYTQNPLQLYTQTYTDTFAQRPFYNLLYIGSLTTHIHFYTQTLLHTNTFTHKHLYTQALVHVHTAAHAYTSLHTQLLYTLHTEAFTRKRFYKPEFLHTGAFTPRRFYTQKLLHTNAFTHRSFYTQTDPLTGPTKFAILPQFFFTLEPHFVRTGCRRTNQIHNFTSVFDLTLETHFVQKGCYWNFTSVFEDQTSFLRKGCR